MYRYVCGIQQLPLCLTNRVVHGFAQAVYDVDEDDRLDTEFRLNVKGMTAFSGLINIRGTITAEAAGTASKNKN